MAVKVLIPTPLRQFTGKQSSIECSAATVGEALGSLTGTFPNCKKHLFTDEGKIRSFVNVYLNDEDIRFLDKENTPNQGWRHDQHRAFDRRRLRPQTMKSAKAEEFRGERPWQFRQTALQQQRK